MFNLKKEVKSGLNSAFSVLNSNFKWLLLSGFGVYFITKFNKKQSTNYNNTLANQSNLSDAEVYSVIDEIIYSVNSLLGTDEYALLDAIKNLTSSDWAKVNKLYGKRGYISYFGQVATDLIDDNAYQKFDLKSMLKVELSNNKGEPIYNKIKELYRSIKVTF